MLVPDNGFGQPCCADCGEHNARGCPGNSSFCVEDRYAALDFQIRKLQDAVDDLAASVGVVLPDGEHGRNLAALTDMKVAASASALEVVRNVVDESRSWARPLRVEPQEDVA